MEPRFCLLVEKLFDQYLVDASLTPEITLVWDGWEKLAEAYVLAYQTFGLLLDWFAAQLGLSHYGFEHLEPRLLEYLERHKLRQLKGETKAPFEERLILQFTVFGNLAGISVRLPNSAFSATKSV